jgi:hypothetical protein
VTPLLAFLPHGWVGVLGEISVGRSGCEWEEEEEEDDDDELLVLSFWGAVCKTLPGGLKASARLRKSWFRQSISAL